MHSHRPKGARFFQKSRLKIENRIGFWSPVCCGQDKFLFSDNSSPNELWISIFKVFLLVQLEFPIIQSELFCLNSHLTPFLLCPQAKSQFQVTGVWCNCSLHSPTCFVLMHLVSERWSRCFTCWQDTACSNTANIDSRIPIPIPLEAIRCWSISGPLMSKSAISPRPAEVTYLVTKDKNP